MDEAFSCSSLFEYFELQQQLLASVSDQCLHGMELGNYIDQLNFNNNINTTNNNNIKLLYNNINQLICEKQKEYTILPIADMSNLNHLISKNYYSPFIPSMNPLNFVHFINYGGSYYSYLYARLWSAQIWCNQFQSSPLSR